MPTYRYEAFNKLGVPSTGSIDAPSPEEAGELLRQGAKGETLFVQKVEPDDGSQMKTVLDHSRTREGEAEPAKANVPPPEKPAEVAPPPARRKAETALSGDDLRQLLGLARKVARTPCPRQYEARVGNPETWRNAQDQLSMTAQFVALAFFACQDPTEAADEG